jgi:hypothetical protein
MSTGSKVEKPPLPSREEYLERQGRARAALA